MRRSPAAPLAALVLALGAGVLPSLLPSTAGADTEVRHFQDADQLGSTDDDRVLDLALQFGYIASSGTTAGALPGETHQGGLDAFVRMGVQDIIPQPGPFLPVVTQQIGSAGDDRALAVTTDGFVTMAGGTTDGALAGDPAGGLDGWVWALDREGEEVWSDQLGGPGDDAVLDLATDLDGFGTWAAGHADGEGFVRRYDPEGDLVWEETPGTDVTHLLLGEWGGIDNYPLVMVVERPSNLPGGEPRYRLEAINAVDGAQLWSGAWLPDPVTAITTDGTAFYVAGSTVREGELDSYVTGLTATGGVEWRTHFFEGLAGHAHDDRPTGIAWDSNVVVLTVHDATHPSDTMVAVSATGTTRWSRRLPLGFDTTTAVAAASPNPFAASYLLVGGATDPALTGTGAGGTDAVVARYLTWQPDAQATRNRLKTVAGDDWYGRPHQRLVIPVRGLEKSSAWVVGQNDGDTTQRLRIRSCASHDGYRIRYNRHGVDRTAEVTEGTYRTGPLGVNERGYVAIEVTPKRRTTGTTTCRFTITSPTTGEKDRFTLVIKRP